jgi:CRISPR/Cas system CMR-associated protein Cmr5 small subunit
MTMRVDQGMARLAADMLYDVDISEELRTRYLQLPVMLRTSGLAATYAFLVAKSSDTSGIGRAHQKVADGIRTHLTGTPPPLVHMQGTTNLALVRALAELSDPVAYTRATAEVEALAGWLKRLAEAKSRHGAGV